MTQLHVLIRIKPPIAAYTLDGKQPVKCTIISPDPIFYRTCEDPEAA